VKFRNEILVLGQAWPVVGPSGKTQMQNDNIRLLVGSQDVAFPNENDLHDYGLDDEEEDDGRRTFLYQRFELPIEPTHSFGHHIENTEAYAAPHRVRYTHCRGS
jgi:hypothetical protein